MARSRTTNNLRKTLEDKLQQKIIGLQDSLRESKTEISRLVATQASLEAIVHSSESIAKDLDEARYHGLQSAVATAQLIQRLGTELERCANTGLGLGPVMSASSVEGLSVKWGPLAKALHQTKAYKEPNPHR